jgi:uncharacterized protein (TIGR00255 family)
MTGYASITRETSAGTLTIELKSVNSRFLDLQFRVNDDLRALEPVLREAIMARVVRGKVECRVSFGRKVSGSSQALNQDILASLASHQQEIRSRFQDAASLSVNEILRWPGVIEEAELGQETLQTEVATATSEALDLFIESRVREGASLQQMLVSRINEMEAIVGRISPLLPQVVAQFQQKAVERMSEALGVVLQGTENASQTNPTRDEILDRIRQEVTMYGIRIDVAEELTRLSAHLSETRHILQKGGQVGKRLDFMMQELNREANTLGSKAAIKELADASMALKLLIEQMREQVQNLE